MVRRDGRIGECLNVGGGNEVPNVDVAEMNCDLPDEVTPPLPGRKLRRELSTFVADRPRHDRYAIDARKMASAGDFCGRFAADRRLVSCERGWWKPLRAAAKQRLGRAG